MASRAFHRDGAVLLKQVFDQQWIDTLRCGLAANRKSPSGFGEEVPSAGSAGHYFNDYCNWQRIPEYKDFLFNSGVSSLAADIVGTQNCFLYHEHVFCKDEGNSSETPWHQDQAYYPFNGAMGVSLWIPLDPIPAYKSLKFIRGSHRRGIDRQRWYIPRKFATLKNYELNKQVIESTEGSKELTFDGITYSTTPHEFTEDDVISWDVEPGDVVAFHFLSLHAADAYNSTENPRRVFACRWFGDDITCAERPWEISPPFTGGLLPGESIALDKARETFPLLYTKVKQESESIE